MKKSIWTDTIKLPEFKTMKGDIKTDVLIIGGGLCGVLCAYFLDAAGVDYVLVEGAKIASGVTRNTTAKITSQHGIIYSKLSKSFGDEVAAKYLKVNQSAIEKYKNLAQNIKCDYEEKCAYTYSVDDRKMVEDEAETVNRIGFNANFTVAKELPFKTKGAVCFPQQAQFNPLKFIAEISKNLNIYENSFVKEITPTTAVTKDGKITAQKIIVATHFPFINKHGSYFLKLYQHRSYVIAYRNVDGPEGMYVDEDKRGLSFRRCGDYLLVGGGGHRTGKQGGCWQEIEAFMQKIYPKAKACYRWAAQDCMSIDGIPYIGKYSKSTPELYVASGFNKWGITSSMVAAEILCDMVLERENEYADVFSPQRSIVRPQLLVNGIEATVNLLTPTTKRCPHLGCALKWNKAEHSWDCPCHGSRFDAEGKLIDNPSTGNAKI